MNFSPTATVTEQDAAANTSSASASETVLVTALSGATLWPYVTDTGVPSGTVLTPASSNTISQPGIYNALSFHGVVNITASNVILQNCQITGGNSDPFEISIKGGLSNVQINNCTIIGAGTNSTQTGVYGVYVKGNSQVTINASDISGVGTGVTINDGQVVVENNYIHDFGSGPGTHYNGIYYGGGGASDPNFSLLIEHNTIVNQLTQTDTLFIASDFGAVSNVTIDNNILAGGSYAVYVEDTGHGSVTNVSLTNNHLGAGLYGIFDFKGTSPSLFGNVNDAYAILPTLSTVSVATFQSDAAALNQILGGFAIADTAINIFNGLAGLQADAGNITSVTATDTPVVVGVGKFIPDETILNKVVGGFTMLGQASAIQGAIDTIEADIGHINTITAQNGTVSVSVATFQNDATALNHIVGGFAIVDTAANIFNGLAGLQADAGNITSVTATDMPVVVGAGKFIPDEAILDKVVGVFNILGLVANIGANFDALAADVAHIGTVAFADVGTPVLNLTQAQATNDAGLLSKITSPYVLNATTGGATTTTGHGNNLTITAVASGNDIITGDGSGEGFVFGANFGIDTVVDFSQHLANPGNDTISLPSAEFANFETMLSSHTTFSGGNAIIQAGGDQLTLLNMSASQMNNAQGDFVFV